MTTNPNPFYGESGNSPPRSLTELETVIQTGLTSYIEVGRALQEIRANKKYKEGGYNTFEEYCEKRWGFSRDSGQDYINAASVVQNAELTPQNLPAFTQAVELSKLLPNQQKAVAAKTDFPTTTVKELKAKIAKVRGVGPVDPPESEEKTKKPPTLKQWLDEQVTKIALQPYGHNAAKFAKYPWQHPTEIANIEGTKLEIYRKIAAICAEKLRGAK